jgi:signal transduction histidine kinase
MTIRFRLTMWYTALLAVVLLIFSLVLYYFLSAKLYNDVRDELKTQAVAIQRNIDVFEFAGRIVYRLPELQGFKSTSIFLQAYWIRNGRLIPDSNVTFRMDFLTQAERVLHNREGFYEEITAFNTATSETMPLMAYYHPVLIEEEIVGVLQVSTPILSVITTLQNLSFFLWMLGIAALLLSGSLGWFMARKSLKPIDTIIQATERIEKGSDLNQQIVYEGPPDEIGRLTRTINNMLTRIRVAYEELEESYRMQRRFVSDASHELRTPLTTIRGNVDLLEKLWRRAHEERRAVGGEELDLSMEALRDIAEEAQRISRLVNDLLALARADAGYEMEMKPVELRPLLEEVSRRAQFLPRTAEWLPGDYSAVSDVFVHGNKDYLQQLLFIFIENAFKYTPQGEVRMEALLAEGPELYAGIRISDTGRGIEPEALPHIFERFYRADESRGQTPGTGLGLAIAKWILDEHDGSVEVTSLVDQGTTFTIWLPATRQAA